MPVIGSEALIIRTPDRKVKVNGFTPKLGSKTVDLVDAALVYECEFTGKILIMIIMNTLHLKEIKHHLLSPFIMRLAGVEVNEQPKFMKRYPTTKHHSVYLPNDDLRLPLSIKGIVSYLPTQKPSRKEYLDIETRLELTPPLSEWDPHNLSYGISEHCMLDHDGNIATTRDPDEAKNAILRNVNNAEIHEVGVSSIIAEISPTLEPLSLSTDLEG